jgi:hypothetical protein
MLKTPLPEKFDLDSIYSSFYVNKKLNELITYLAELTEVVKGKQDKQNVTYGGGASGTGGTPIGLKEQLLGAVKLKRKLSSYCGYNFSSTTVKTESAVECINGAEKMGYNKALTDIEAIINRLIP